MAKGVKTGGRQKGARNKINRDVQAFVDRIFASRNPVKEFQGIIEHLDAGLDAEETKFFQHEGRVRQTENVINWSARLEAAKLKSALMIRLLEYRYGKPKGSIEVTGNISLREIVQKARERANAAGTD